MELFLGQQKAIDQLLIEYKNNTKIIDFKAPTGAGKTFIAANLISEIINNKLPNEKLVFVIATLSSSDLPKQFAIKLEEYKKYLNNNYSVEIKESPSKNKMKNKDQEASIIAEDNKVIIFGKSSFGKGRILTEYGAFDSFIDQIKTEGYKLIYIRDEAHVGLKQQKGVVQEEKIVKKNNEEQSLHNNADFVVRMTATPDPKYKQIIIKETELQNDEKSLLKTNDVFNKNIKKTGKKEIIDSDLLEIALDEFKNIKTKYSKNKSEINPAALIQVSSLSKELKEEDLDKRVAEYKKVIESKGLTWAVYFGNQKDSSLKEEVNLLNLSSSISPIDVIIFKVGPATGWDIPRACMLIQLRDVASDTLNQQTIGRIKRNPIPGLYKEEFADKYYVYSNYQEPSRELYRYNLKEKFQDVKIPVMVGVETTETKPKALKSLHKALDEWFTNRENKAAINSKISETFSTAIEKIAMKKKRYVDNQSKEAQVKLERVVWNAIQLHIEIEKEISKFEKEWSNMKPIIDLHFKEIKSFIPSVTKTQYYYVLITSFLDSLFKIYQNSFSDEVTYEYKVKEGATLKNSYMIWGNNGKKEEDQNIIDFSDHEKNYAYINTDNTMKHKQALDSNPEKIFIEYVLDYMDNADKRGYKPFDLWAKNPSLGNEVFLEYKNNMGRLSKAFIDFVFKRGDHFIFVEVKGHKDYNEEKTELILSAFKEYKKQNPNNPIIKKMHFAIAVVDTEEHDKIPARKWHDFKIKYKMLDMELNNKASSLLIDEFFDIIEVN